MPSPSRAGPPPSLHSNTLPLHSAAAGTAPSSAAGAWRGSARCPEGRHCTSPHPASSTASATHTHRSRPAQRCGVSMARPFPNLQAPAALSAARHCAEKGAAMTINGPHPLHNPLKRALPAGAGGSLHAAPAKLRTSARCGPCCCLHARLPQTRARACMRRSATQPPHPTPATNSAARPRLPRPAPPSAPGHACAGRQAPRRGRAPSSQ